MVREMCGVQLKDRAKVLTLMLGLSETLDQLSMVNSVRWYGHVLRGEKGHVLGRTLHFEVVGQGEKGRLKRTWRKQVEAESMKVDFTWKNALCRSKRIVSLNLIATTFRGI